LELAVKKKTHGKKQNFKLKAITVQAVKPEKQVAPSQPQRD